MGPAAKHGLQRANDKVIGKTVICVRMVAQQVVTWGTQKPGISNSTLLRFRERNSGPWGRGAGKGWEETGKYRQSSGPRETRKLAF